MPLGHIRPGSIARPARIRPYHERDVASRVARIRARLDALSVARRPCLQGIRVAILETGETPVKRVGFHRLLGRGGAPLNRPHEQAYAAQTALERPSAPL